VWGLSGVCAVGEADTVPSRALLPSPIKPGELAKGGFVHVFDYGVKARSHTVRWGLYDRVRISA